MGELTFGSGGRRALVAVAAVLIVAADAAAVAVTDSGQPAGQQSAATSTTIRHSPTERSRSVVESSVKPRAALKPTHYAWVRPAVVNVWEHRTSPRPVDRVTMSAAPNMRAWAHHLTVAQRLDLNGRLMTQAVHGDRVAVVQSGRGWSLVRLESQTGGAFPRGIVGFVPSAQLSNTPIATPKHTGKRDVATVIATARRYLGVSYLWAGMSRYGIDCSGLTYVAFRAAGITLPRDAADQARLGMPIGRRHLRAGDLVFFGRGVRTNIHHVGIYLGRGLVLHAPHTGARVTITPLAAWSDYWGARRIIG